MRPSSPPAPSAPQHIARLRCVLGALCAVVFAACADDGPVPIVDVANRAQPMTTVPARATDAHRLRLQSRLPSEAELLDYELPDGWARAQPSPNRNPNFRIKDAADVQAYVTVIVPKRGNTMLNNVQRWYTQMGLTPDEVTDEIIEALPKRVFIGEDTHVVDLRGTFTSRGTKVEDARMIAFLHEMSDGFVTFKLVGPEANVTAQEDAFFAIAESMRVKEPSEATPASAAPGSAAHRPTAPVRWTTPPTWKAEAPNPYLIAAFRPRDHPKTRCTISFAGGSVELNINRWREQMSLKSESKEALESLPVRTVLGRDAYVIKLDGDFKGAMKQPPIKDARMLGLVVTGGARLLFVKMLGPRDVMETQEDNFFALCDSLKETT